MGCPVAAHHRGVAGTQCARQMGSAAVCIWHTCFDSWTPVLQMAGRLFVVTAVGFGGGKASHRHFIQGGNNPSMVLSTWLCQRWQINGQLLALEGGMCHCHRPHPFVLWPAGISHHMSPIKQDQRSDASMMQLLLCSPASCAGQLFIWEIFFLPEFPKCHLLKSSIDAGLEANSIVPHGKRTSLLTCCKTL